jgi:thiol:disulfide interchange protein DsbD
MLKYRSFFSVVLLLKTLSFFPQDVQPVKWNISLKTDEPCRPVLIFKADIQKGWHVYSLKKLSDDGPNPTVIKLDPSPDYALADSITESPVHEELDKVFEVKVQFHENAAEFYVPVKILSKKDKITIKGTYEYQACDSARCIFPPAESFELTYDNKCTKVVSASSSSSSPSFWSIFIQGFIGGFLALLTPCVFPMIPMNVSFFTKRSKNRKEGVRNAFIYALFIVIIYVSLGLGITAIFGAGALHSLSTNVWFNLAFFVLLLIFAFSFLGAFEIVLPSSWVNKADQKSEKGGLTGIFFMAFTLSLVSFSCTGPIIGTLLVQAASTGNYTGPFWGMFGFALALSVPFGFFAAFPGYLNSLPKSGGWLNAVKVTLGYLELALALKFASNADLVVQAGILTREVFITLWIVIFGMLGLYLLGLYKTAHDTDVKYLSVTRLMFALLSLSMTVYLIPGLWGAPLKLLSGILPPLEYSESPYGFGGGQIQMPLSHNNGVSYSHNDSMPEMNKNGILHFKNDFEKAMAYARKVNRPLMVDFTGHACANCRKTEDYVWPDPEVKRILNEEVVLVSLYVDDKRELPPSQHQKVNWHGKERIIKDIGDKFKYLEETIYGQSTQPLYVILDHNGNKLTEPRGYDPDIQAYIRWLKEGIAKFKNGKN